MKHQRQLLFSLLLLFLTADAEVRTAATRIPTASPPAAADVVDNNAASASASNIPPEVLLANIPPEVLANLPKDFDPSSLPPELVASFLANLQSGNVNVTELLTNLPPIPNLKDMKVDIPDFAFPPVALHAPKIPSLKDMVPAYLSFLVPRGF